MLYLGWTARVLTGAGTTCLFRVGLTTGALGCAAGCALAGLGCTPTMEPSGRIEPLVRYESFHSGSLYYTYGLKYLSALTLFNSRTARIYLGLVCIYLGNTRFGDCPCVSVNVVGCLTVDCWDCSAAIFTIYACCIRC